jgi:hypothetical protein
MPNIGIKTAPAKRQKTVLFFENLLDEKASEGYK